LPCPFDEASLEQYAKAIDLGARTWEGMFEDAARRLFDEERREILKILKKTGKGGRKAVGIPYQQFLLEVEQYLEMAGERWREVFLPLFTAYIGAQGQVTAATFGMAFDVMNAQAIQFLRDYTMDFAEEIVGKTRQEVGDIISTGQQEGWSIPRMRDELMEEFDEFSTTRAVNIARTETIRSSAAGSMEAYSQYGIQRAQWYGVQDGRLCGFCEEMVRRFGPGTEGFVIGSTLWETGQEMTIGQGEEVQRLRFNYQPVQYPPLHSQCRCTVLPVI
jgi:hypothetical protein